MLISGSQPSYGHSGALPGDNPVYEKGITSSIPRNPITANMLDTKKSSNGDGNESVPDKEFDNPIYGREARETVYSVPDSNTKTGMRSELQHKFVNPIYGDTDR